MFLNIYEDKFLNMKWHDILKANIMPYYIVHF